MEKLFYVVKENGWGNFHNLINLSDEWVLILLEKWLVDKKAINILSYFKMIPRQVKRLKETLEKIILNGDLVFKNKNSPVAQRPFPAGSN